MKLAPLGPDGLRRAELERRSAYGLARLDSLTLLAHARRRAEQLLLLLHEIACPVDAPTLRQSWYARGAVARVSSAKLARLLRERFPSKADATPGTVRLSLARLVDLGLVVRAPDQDRTRKHPDTLYLVTDPQEARWWARRGSRVLEQNPDARRSPRLWRRLLGSWRAAVRQHLRRLTDWLEERSQQRAALRAVRRAPKPQGTPQEQGRRLKRAAIDGDPAAMREALKACGVRFTSGWRFALWRRPERVAAAVALLIQRTKAVGWPEDAASWLVAVFKRGGADAGRALHALRKAAEPVPGPLASLGIDLGGILKSAAIPDADADLERLRVGLSRW